MPYDQPKRRRVIRRFLRWLGIALLAVMGALAGVMVLVGMYSELTRPHERPQPELVDLLRRTEVVARGLTPGQEADVDVPTLRDGKRIVFVSTTHFLYPQPDNLSPRAQGQLMEWNSKEGRIEMGVFLVHRGEIEGLIATDWCNLLARRETAIIEGHHRRMTIRCDEPRAGYCRARWNPQCLIDVVGLN